MHGTHFKTNGGAPRVRVAQGLYAVLLAGGIAALADRGAGGLLGHPVIVAALTAIGLSAQLTADALRTRVARSFDMDLALALAAVALAGPVAALVVIAIPQVVYLARHRRAWGFELVCEAVSFLGTPLAGAYTLRAIPAAGITADAARLLIVGGAMLGANYLLARLLPAVIRDRAHPAQLLRAELLAIAPLEIAVIAIGTLCALLLPSIGIPALAGFVALSYVPQLAVAELTRAPSVARLPVEQAARIYRDALADELDLSRSERRLAHQIDALVERRALGELPLPSFAAMQDALVVNICRSRKPTQRHFSASPGAQVVLVARRWSELTARCTPALNHVEALAEIRASSLIHDAPSAVGAAERIVEREDALSEHVAGVPRLHRAPGSRALRRVLLVAVDRLAV